MEIFTDAQKVTWEKVIIYKTSITISDSKFVLNYYVDCQVY